MSARPDDGRSAAGLTPWAVIALPEELNVQNSARAAAELAGAGQQAATVVGDMSDTRFCDSSAVAALLRAHKDLAAKGNELRLVITALPVLRILSITGADQVLRIYDSRAAATDRAPS